MGQMLFKCLEARSPGMRKALDDSRKQFHFDPLKQVDRMAVSPDHVVAFSGFFKGVDFDGMFPNQPRVAYGDHAVIYEPPPGVVRGQPYLAVWNDELLLVGHDEGALRHTIDQLEGRAPRPAPAISPDDAYGDAYGSLPGDVIAKVVGHENPTLANRISQGVSSAKVHFDASGDVSLNAGFQARDGADLKDLERSLAGALAAARVTAQAEGKPHLADLLDDARVVPRGSGFALDLQVPEQWVKDALGNCAIFGPPPRRASKTAPPTPDAGAKEQPPPAGR